MNKVACSRCGVPILVRTAMRNDGMCIPCKNGTRDSLGNSRRWYREHLERARTDPSSLYWYALVDRVHQTTQGFDGLSEAERKYFAVCCLAGEVHNGGFGQFFSNSSGSYYRYAVAGLQEMDASDCLQLLERAKQVLFDFAEVPEDTGARHVMLHRKSSGSRDSRCEGLDELFWKAADDLRNRIEQYAKRNNLY